MKTKLLSLSLIAFLLSVGTVKAQFFGNLIYPYACDTIKLQEWETSGNFWETDEIQRYVVDANGFPDLLYSYDSSGNLQYFADYDIQNGQPQKLELYLNFQGTNILFTQMTFTYDANGNVTEQLIKELDNIFGGTLQNSERTRLTYDGTNHMQVLINEEWDDSKNPADWTIDLKGTYSYATNPFPVSHVDSTWDPGINAYVFLLKHIYTYSGAGDLMEDRYENSAGGTNGRITYLYNAAHMEMRELRETYSGVNYFPSEVDTTVYDGANKVTEEIHKYYQSGAWLNDSRKSCASPFVLGMNSMLERMKLSVFPNPTSGIVNMAYNADQSGVMNIEVYDMKGSLVKEVSISKSNGFNSDQIDLSELENGLYLIKGANEGETFSQKVLINK